MRGSRRSHECRARLAAIRARMCTETTSRTPRRWRLFRYSAHRDRAAARSSDQVRIVGGSPRDYFHGPKSCPYSRRIGLRRPEAAVRGRASCLRGSIRSLSRLLPARRAHRFLTLLQPLRPARESSAPARSSEVQLCRASLCAVASLTQAQSCCRSSGWGPRSMARVAGARPFFFFFFLCILSEHVQQVRAVRQSLTCCRNVAAWLSRIAR